MKFLIDENIPYAHEFFADLGEVQRFAGRELKSEQLIDADVLLVRSITKVNAELLSQANKLQFVGTATIGEDHIDKALLKQKGIHFSSAPGCNAVSVAEFVISALYVLAEKYNFELTDKTLGIVGVGNIGKVLQKKAQALGFKILLCDPPRAKQESCDDFVELNELLAKSDIVTFHTPLTRDGDNPSFHLLNEHNIQLLKQDVVLVNASRGEVIDNRALYQEVLRRQNSNELAIKLVLDVWENEPNPMPELIDHCDLVSAHIAGYSLEGKARGTEMLYHKVCELFDFDNNKQLSDLLPAHPVTNLTFDKMPETQNELKALIHLIYDVRRDDALFRQLLNDKGFDWLRKNYPQRREWSSIPLVFNCSDQKNSKFLQLGFDI